MGEPQTVLTSLEPLTIGVEVTSHVPLQDVVVGVRIDTLSGERVWGWNTRRAGKTIGRLDGPARVDLSIPTLPLLEGVYDLTVALSDHTEMHPYDHWERRIRFEVRQYRSYDVGVVHIPASGRSAERRPSSSPIGEPQVPSLVRISRRVDERDKVAGAELATLVADPGTARTSMVGIAPREAADSLETGDVRRFSAAVFARVNGTAPIPGAPARAATSQSASLATPAVKPCQSSSVTSPTSSTGACFATSTDRRLT